MLKKLSWVLGSLLALLILVVVLGVMFFPKQKVLRLLESKASEATASPVTVSDVGISFSPMGLRVTGFQMGDTPKVSKPVVKLAELRVGLKLMPLFSKRLEVTEIYIRAPHVTVLQAPPNRNSAAKGRRSKKSAKSGKK